MTINNRSKMYFLVAIRCASCVHTTVTLVYRMKLRGDRKTVTGSYGDMYVAWFGNYLNDYIPL
jgi:hypothetical protein